MTELELLKERMARAEHDLDALHEQLEKSREMQRALEVAMKAFRKAAKESIDRWAGETGDGSMWGNDAYVWLPLRKELGLDEGMRVQEENSALDYESRLDRLKAENARLRAAWDALKGLAE